MLNAHGDATEDTIPSIDIAEGRHGWGTWPRTAIVKLLCCMHSSLALSLLMDSTTAPNRILWDAFAASMLAHGYPQAWVQLWAWWKAEKFAFHRERAHRA